MHSSNVLGVVSSLLMGPMSTMAPIAAPPKAIFNAISARDGRSVFECWQLDAPVSFSSDRSVSGSAMAPLGSLANASYHIYPGDYDVGVHTAPRKQWALFLKGMALFTLPDDDSAGFYVSAGDIIFAADTADVSERGHNTRLLSMDEHICMFLPTKDGEEPAHEVLHSGPCDANELGSLRKLALSGSM
ncbi:hypothetical protein GGR53DRAFT_34073 [Hypoxylon sp. FL1150]|nr:hypothetical protein GGR53DRAFT_34073 [Hypoxylon sp. FL1150]